MNVKIESHSVRDSLFIALGGVCRKLPTFRGRNRFFLLSHKLLGLQNKHLQITTSLDRPVKFKAKLDVHSWLQRLAFISGSYEADAVHFLRRLWQSQNSRGCLLDIGANIGLISIPFSMLTRDQSKHSVNVISVEAVPDNVKALKANIALNALESSIKVIGTALGDVAKTIEIQVEGDLSAGQGTGTANILPDGSDYICVRQKLELKPLDHLLETGELPVSCSLIKIDTDGYDLKVLEGGIKFLSENRPVIFGEFAAHCMNWHKQSILDVVKFAKENGYLVWQRSSPAWKFSESIKPEMYSQDLLLVPEESRVQFLWCLVEES